MIKSQELNALYSLIENIIDDIPKELFDNLQNKMKPKVFHDVSVLMEVGDPIIDFYYLKEGIVSGFNKEDNLVWFCESNEIILFHEFIFKNSSSLHQIVVEKGSLLYKISMRDLYEIIDETFIDKMLKACIKSNIYFLDLHTNMKSQSLSEKIKVLLVNHEQFLNTRLQLLSSFLGASLTSVSRERKKLQTN